MAKIVPVRLITFSLSFLLVAACVKGPDFDKDRYQNQTTPQQVVKDIDSYRDSNVLWGGMLISSTNLKDGTQLEVLAYPLHSSQKPDSGSSPLGRFLVIDNRFLEPVDYAGGRLITVTGKLADTKRGQVGSAQYTYPVINAEQIFLWPKNRGQFEPGVHFGFGFIFSN